MMKDIQITAEHIPEAYKELAEVIGTKAFFAMCQQYGGTAVYFPTITIIIRPVRDSKICSEYDKTNCRELALKYGLSQTQIRKIVSDE